MPRDLCHLEGYHADRFAASTPAWASVSALALALALAPAMALALCGLPGCRERSVGTLPDAGHLPDGAVIPDAASGSDAGPGCADQRLRMGFVWSTHVTPSQPEPDLEVYEVEGAVTYHGAITVPIAMDPAFQREIQVDHAGGQVTVVQYHLPAGAMVPTQVGSPYTFWLRRVLGAGVYSTGVAITRPTSGVPPLIFVADVGERDRVFSPEDPVMAPLKVYVEPRPECPPIPDPDCGGHRFMDQLRFDSSTGGMITDAWLAQGETADLAVFGEPWRVMNLASSHVDQVCPDAPSARVSYLGVNQAAYSCDTSRFYFWSTPDAIEVGSYCDLLYTCADSPSQAAAMEAVSADIQCGLSLVECGSGALGCTWNSSEPVDQALYDQLCAVSVLPDPPERINCNTYLP